MNEDLERELRAALDKSYKERKVLERSVRELDKLVERYKKDYQEARDTLQRIRIAFLR